MATGSVVQEARYILTNIAGNNNKFWNIRLRADDTCETHWGRVGEDGQRKVFPRGGAVYFESKCREKSAKGYRLQKTLANTAGNGLATEALAQAATTQIVTESAETRALVEFLARVNVHRILDATTMTYDESRGTFSTPLGIVTQEALTEARQLLMRLGSWVAADDFGHACFVPTLNDYLMLIPQNLGRAQRDPASLLPDVAAIQRQSDLLDALEASLEMALQDEPGQECAPLPQLFEARLQRVEAVGEIERIRRFFRSTQQAQHACAHLDIQRVFAVDIAAMDERFEARGRAVGGIRELWHGTQAGNLLSILRSGFVIPPAGASHCTGRMFGNGVYFSDQSTKSLNYAYGYWRGHTDERCFMFLCEVALGRSFRPASWCHTLDPRDQGYDSTFAEAGVCGVANNEMIVYDTAQIRPRYLVEFGRAGQ